MIEERHLQATDAVNVDEEDAADNSGLLSLSTSTQVGIATGFLGLPLLAGVVEFLHLGFTGLVIGTVGTGVVAYAGKRVLDRHRGARGGDHLTLAARLRSANWAALLGPLDEESGASQQQASSSPVRQEHAAAAPATPLSTDGREQAAAAAGISAAAALASSTQTPDAIFGAGQSTGPALPVARLTIDQIVAHTRPNSFALYIGRSLTSPRHQAICVSFYKRHFKFIGASQKGKSSMAAAFLEIITRTHDPDHVLLALLDLEDQTSKLFANTPHLAEVLVDGHPVVLHARSREQVLEYLSYIVAVMDERYTLSKNELASEPVLLVYIEEFLALKDYFKRRIDSCRGEQKEQAKKDYNQLIFTISELARRGLKVRVQLLLCAQVDYRDEDLQEALINITSGMSFCVRVSAAQAAGFYNTELLKRNVLMDLVGTAVVEMPECKDLILAPEYDLERRLLALEEAELAAERRRSQTARARHTSVVPASAANWRQTSNDQAVPPLTGGVTSPWTLREQIATQPPAAGERPRHLYSLPRHEDVAGEEYSAEDRSQHTQPSRLSPQEQMYEQALAAWEQGARSIRKMQKALGIRFNEARDLLSDMEKAGLITWRLEEEVEEAAGV